MENYLKAAALTPALSGHEERMRALLRREFEACGLPVQTDALGNCMARIEGTDPSAPVVMVFAHMDSLGFVVRYIEEDGFIRIERLGGIPEKVLPQDRNRPRSLASTPLSASSSWACCTSLPARARPALFMWIPA